MSAGAPVRVDIAGPTDAGDFRAHANSMLAQQVPPNSLDWHPLTSSTLGVAFHGDGDGSNHGASALHSIVPRSFVRLTELVVLHRDPARFDLLYRLLWELVHEPEAARQRRDLALAQSMAQAVRRDIQKTARAVWLRPLPPDGDVVLSVAWCEPQHQVTEQVAQRLAKTQPAPWILASPDRCVLWTGRHLLCGPGMSAGEASTMSAAGWYAMASDLVASTVARAS
ncbi:MAG TPA: hypothetical protein VHL79_08215 [Ramlibacter sp.]|jgi:DNA polymerase|nr:hypothetical protein [Ramlibacter sp.]